MPRKTGEQRREEIIAVARELIFCEGFSNFTIRTVASRIGISEAAIYRHFASKEELMLGMLATLFDPWRVAVDELAAGPASASEKLQQLVELHLHHLIIRQLNPVLFFSEAISPENSRLLALLNSNLQFLLVNVRKILAFDCMEGRLNGSIDIDAAAVCVVGILQTTVIKWTLQRSETGLKEEAARLMGFFCKLLTDERKHG